MTILARAYLGPPEDIAALHKELTEWRAICASLLDSSEAQSNDDFSRVASAGAAAAMRVLDRIQVIAEFAQGTADRQYAEAERRNSALEAAVIAMFATVLLGASVVGGLLTRQISHRVLELTSVAAQFAQGKLDVRSTSGSANELGALANTFNAMADTIQANLESTAQLTEQLRRSEASLSAQNKELEAFSYSVSHDLRTPLRSIDGFSRILIEDHDASLDAEGRDCLRRIRTAAEYMGQLIDDLLRLSRLSRGELRYEEVDLSAMVHEVAAELAQQDPQRQVTLVVADGVLAHGDRRMLRVVLANLLGNAWKFTRTQTAPRIEFGTISEDGRPRYFVRDNGVGYDPQYADKLFGAFQRLHGKAEFPGTGIGLATVQRVIHRHGGSVWAQGAVDRGATFSFDLGTQAIAA
jgi:signal transduction histidine kinase